MNGASFAGWRPAGRLWRRGPDDDREARREGETRRAGSTNRGAAWWGKAGDGRSIGWGTWLIEKVRGVGDGNVANGQNSACRQYRDRTRLKFEERVFNAYRLSRKCDPSQLKFSFLFL